MDEVEKQFLLFVHREVEGFHPETNPGYDLSVHTIECIRPQLETKVEEILDVLDDTMIIRSFAAVEATVIEGKVHVIPAGLDMVHTVEED